MFSFLIVKYLDGLLRNKIEASKHGEMTYEDTRSENIVGEGTFGLLFAGLIVSGMIYYSRYILHGAIDIEQASIAHPVSLITSVDQMLLCGIVDVVWNNEFIVILYIKPTLDITYGISNLYSLCSNNHLLNRCHASCRRNSNLTLPHDRVDVT